MSGLTVLFNKFIETFSSTIDFYTPEPANIQPADIVKVYCSGDIPASIRSQLESDPLTQLYTCTYWLLRTKVCNRFAWESLAKCMSSMGYVPVVNDELQKSSSVWEHFNTFMENFKKDEYTYAPVMFLVLIIPAQHWAVVESRERKVQTVDTKLFEDNYRSLCKLQNNQDESELSYKGRLRDIYFEVLHLLYGSEDAKLIIAVALYLTRNYTEQLNICACACVAVSVNNIKYSKYIIAKYAAENGLALTFPIGSDELALTSTFLTDLSDGKESAEPTKYLSYIKPIDGSSNTSPSDESHVLKALSVTYHREVKSLPSISLDKMQEYRKDAKGTLSECIKKTFAIGLDESNFDEMAGWLMALSDSYVIIPVSTMKQVDKDYTLWRNSRSNVVSEYERIIWVMQQLVLVPKDNYHSVKSRFYEKYGDSDKMQRLCYINAETLMRAFKYVTYGISKVHPIFLMARTYMHLLNRDESVAYEVSNVLMDMARNWKDISYQLTAMLRTLHKSYITIDVRDFAKCISFWGYKVEMRVSTNSTDFSVTPYDSVVTESQQAESKHFGTFSEDTMKAAEAVYAKGGLSALLEIVCKTLDSSPKALKDTSHSEQLDKCLSTYVKM